jgi:hypothetical protein
MIAEEMNISVTAPYFSDAIEANKNDCFISLVTALALCEPRLN